MLKIITTIGLIQAIAIVITMIRSKIMAVSLGPEGIGIISIIDQLVTTVAQISAFSLPTAAVKFLSRAHSKDLDAFKVGYSTMLRGLLLLTISGMVISLGVVFWRIDLLGPELSPYSVYLYPALLSVPAITLHGFFSNTLASIQKSRESAVLALIIAISFTVAAYLGILLSGILGLYWANLIASILVVIMLMIYLERRFNIPLLGEGFNFKRELRENSDIIAFSLMLYGSSFVYPLSYFVARYGVFTYWGEAAAGLLQAGIALSGALSLVLKPTNALYLMPILNRSSPKEEKIRTTLEFQRKFILAIGALAMPIVLFPQLLLTLMFSPSFVQVAPVLFLFVVAQCVLLLSGVYQALILGLDDLKMFGLMTTIGYFSFGLLSWLLTPIYAVSGVAVSLLISNTLTLLLMLARLFFKYSMVLSHKLWFSAGYVFLALLLAGIFFNQVEPWSISTFGLKIVIYLLFVGSLLISLNREEIQWLLVKIWNIMPVEKGNN